MRSPISSRGISDALSAAIVCARCKRRQLVHHGLPERVGVAVSDAVEHHLHRRAEQDNLVKPGIGTGLGSTPCREKQRLTRQFVIGDQGVNPVLAPLRFHAGAVGARDVVDPAAIVGFHYSVSPPLQPVQYGGSPCPTYLSPRSQSRGRRKARLP